MRELAFLRTNTNADRLWDELYEAYGDMLKGMKTGPFGIVVRADDEFTDDAGVELIIFNHDETQLSKSQEKVVLKELRKEWLASDFDPESIRTDIVNKDLELAVEKIIQVLEAVRDVLNE